MASRLRELILRIVGARTTPPQAGGSGARAEELAARFLRARNARILERNVRCRGGEIDLIADDDGTVAFVEVRLRSGRAHGGAAASITLAKQRRLVLAAQYWQYGSGAAYRHRPCRFDAVLLDGLHEARIEWLKGAFEPP